MSVLMDNLKNMQLEDLKKKQAANQGTFWQTMRAITDITKLAIVLFSACIICLAYTERRRKEKSE